MRPVARFLCESQSHVNRLYTGDHTSFPLPTELRTDSEWAELFLSILARGDVELRDVDIDTEVEIFVWTYMHYVVFYFCSKWPQRCSFSSLTVVVSWLKFQRDLRHRKVAYIPMTPFFSYILLVS